MYRQKVTFGMVLVRLLGPLAVLGIGAALVMAWAYVMAYGVVWGTLLLFFLVSGVCGILFFCSTRPWVGIVAGALLFLSVGPAVSVIQEAALDAHGRSGVCQVLDVVKRTTQEYVSDNDGNGGGHWETRTDYRHSLRCPPGGPDRLTRGRALAHKGETLEVVWDGRGRVAPLAVSERHTPRTWWTIFLVMMGIALLVLWQEACLDLFQYPRHSSGDSEMSFMNLAEGPLQGLRTPHR